jgi:photosystem II stability/assembly factor-like uncharacterized protein
MVGPSRGGRVTAVAGDPINKQAFYFGSTGGGIWKTEDGGIGWLNVSDGFVNTGSVGALAVGPSNTNIVYAGMGEACVRGDASYGDGVYRSADAGKIWTHVGLEATRSIARVRVHPKNPDLVYVAAFGDPWGPSAERGVYRSKDAGRTWKKILFRSRPQRVWALIDAEPGTKGIYRSDDAGQTWRHLTDDAELTMRPWYYHHIFADPKDPNLIYVLNVGAWKSTDGGEKFVPFRPPHGDHHDLWIDPEDPKRMIEDNDGDATVSFNAGASWSTVLNQPTAQIYHVVADRQFPHRIYGSQQDNTTIVLPSRSDFGRITIEDWETVGGGEDGYIANPSENLVRDVAIRSSFARRRSELAGHQSRPDASRSQDTRTQSIVRT